MKSDVMKRNREKERLTEAYEVRAFRDESEQIKGSPVSYPESPHAETSDLQSARSRVMLRGEQRVVPDDCQFGDNELCSGEF